jgi:hypothetical protein
LIPDDESNRYSENVYWNCIAFAQREQDGHTVTDRDKAFWRLVWAHHNEKEMIDFADAIKELGAEYTPESNGPVRELKGIEALNEYYDYE